MTAPLAPRGDGQEPLAGAAGSSGAAALTETCLTKAGLRERGWTDGMIRDYLGEPDATRPNPRYPTAAPMKLYLAERADAVEASPDWAERMARGARRRAAGMAGADRKRAETEALARELAAGLVASLVLPADPRRRAVEAYNEWHSAACTCPGWHDLGFCGKRAGADDAPDFLRRITVDYARRRLAGYGRAHNQLAGRAGQRGAREILRSAVDAAIEARLGAGEPAAAVSAAEVPRK